MVETVAGDLRVAIAEVSLPELEAGALVSLVTVPCHPGARITSAKDASRAIALAEAINRLATSLRS